MRKIYTSAILMLAMVSSCSNEEEFLFDGSTSLDETVDYSTFKAAIEDVYGQKEITTRAAQTSAHIGFPNKYTPDLNVVFDNNTELPYTYDVVTDQYSTIDGDFAEAKALYMYSTEQSEDGSGAIVAAKWPVEFNAQKATPIKLHNMKSRVNVSYKYKIEEGITPIKITGVSVGDIYTDAEFSMIDNNNALVYSVVEGSDKETVEATKVTTSKEILNEDENTDDFVLGSFESFVIPQTLNAYNAYIEFLVDGRSFKYYFKNDVSIESSTLYKLVFEIENVENGFSITLTSQESVKDWEDNGDMDMDIDPSNPIVSEWDGSSKSEFAYGDGSEANPYQIRSADELAFLMDKSQNKVSRYLEANYILMINIDWKGAPWVQLGFGGGFMSGTFDGNNKTVKNIAVSNVYNNVGFIAMLGKQDGSSPGVVKDLTVKGIVKSIPDATKPNLGNNFGGVVGCVSKQSRVENCHFIGEVIGNYQVGGIAGSSSGDIIGCTVKKSRITAIYDENSAYKPTTAQRGSAGGLVGKAWSGNISYSLSSDNVISGYSEVVGALVGWPGNDQVLIANCLSSDNDNQSPSAIYGLVAKTATGQDVIRIDSYHTMVDVLDEDVYADFDMIGGQKLSNMLNGSGDMDFEPDGSTEWYWRSNGDTSIPSPVYYPNEKQ